MSLLNEIGFSVAEFGGDSFIIDALPLWIMQQPLRDMIINIARSFSEYGSKAAIREGLAENIIKNACAEADYALDDNNHEKINRLVSDLSKTEMPYISPKGNPTVLFKSYTELNTFFKKP